MRLCVVLAGWLFSACAYAALFEGIAPVGMDGVAAARTAAIADALENASLGSGASVQASTLSNNSKNADALHVRGQPVGPHTVLNEWQANGFYHVTLNVAPAPSGAAIAAPIYSCGPDYRRKALVTRMPILNPVQIPDLTRFPEELQAELARRLEASDHFLPQNSGNEAAIVVQPSRLDPEWNPGWIRDLARRYGVQLIVGGVVRDAGFEGERYALSYDSDIRPGERKQDINLPMLKFIKPGIKATPSARRFEMDLFIFDGVSGAQISRHRLAGRAKGHVLWGGEMVMDPGISVGTQRFFASDFGKLIDAKLDEAVETIKRSVQCLPFSARITQVEPGRVYVDAGGTSKLAPGDRLQIYRLRPGAHPVNAVGQPGQLGWPEELAGSITIRDVQPLFASGTPENGVRVEVGDYVRFAGKEEKR